MFHSDAKGNEKELVKKVLLRIEIWVGIGSVSGTWAGSPLGKIPANQRVMQTRTCASNGLEIRTKPCYAALAEASL